MQEIQTERLTLRNFRKNDWSDLQEMIVQFVASPYAKYDHEWPTSEDKLQEVAEWFAAGDKYLAVCLQPDEAFIGFVCLNPVEGSEGAALDIGYIFNSDFHGKGYATEACQAAIRYAFTKLLAERVVGGTHPANEPSCRLLARLGLEPMPEAEGVYELTREQWEMMR